MWKTENIDLGRIPVKQKQVVEFEYTGTGIFHSTKASCGCTVSKWDISNSTLRAEYTPKEIPVHLSMDGKTEYDTTKYIHVQMKEGDIIQTYSLKITGKVYAK